MPRFTRGARVRFVEEKTTGQVGTVLDIVPKTARADDFDRYRVEFSDGEIKNAFGLGTCSSWRGSND